MTSQPRPEVRLVPMTREQRNMLQAIGETLQPVIAEHLFRLVDGYEAAPADAAEAVANACRTHEYPGGKPGPIGGRGRYSQANAILAALGYPHTEQA